jgi:hypothetical protein
MTKENAAIAIYNTHPQAEAAIKELQKSGIPKRTCWATIMRVTA